jgi:hypothetical protein
MPKGGKRTGAGRKPIGPAPRSPRLTITLTEDDIAYLKAINPNLSAAVRLLIAQARHSHE